MTLEESTRTHLTPHTGVRQNLSSADKMSHVSPTTCGDEGTLLRLWEHTGVDAQLCLSLRGNKVLCGCQGLGYIHHQADGDWRGVLGGQESEDIQEDTALWLVRPLLGQEGEVSKTDVLYFNYVNNVMMIRQGIDSDLGFLHHTWMSFSRGVGE